MSSRALRKLQREQEQQQQLEKANEGSSQDGESEEAIVESKAQNAFDMLIEDAEAEDDESAKAQSSETEDNPAERTQKEDASPPPAKTKSKGKSSKKKNKSKKVGENEQAKNPTKSKNTMPQLDEIDQALQSLSTKDRDGTYAFTNATADDGYEDLHRLLAVESKHLNALNEMKRLFGNVVLEGDDDAEAPGRRHGRRQQRNLDLRGALAAQNSRVSRSQGLAGLALRRNVFMLGKEEWPKATSGGLGMEVVEKQNDGITQYRFVHSTAYQDVQKQFQSCVESMDPQRMVQLLQFNPYHISTLLQVSEIAKQQGDHSVSGDLLERALFSFGRSVHSSFPTALSEGKVRLDFSRPENRELWLAVWRYIQSLGQRGTWRTAYEWAKLLLSFEPERDPYCVRLVLDQLALRGFQMEHFLNLSTAIIYRAEWGNCPNIRISSALAEYKLKRSGACRVSLLTTIQWYPWIFNRLFQALNIDHIPPSIWGKEPRSEREKFECEVYISYAKDLWNSPDAISLLVEVAETAESHDGIRNDSHISFDEARHALLSGTPALITLIPRHYTSMSTSSSDPLPPPDTIESYSTGLPSLPPHRGPPRALPEHPDIDGDAEPNDEEQELQGLQGFFSRIIPWLGQSNRPATEETLNAAAVESGVPQEVIAERGNRLLELLRGVLGRQQEQQRELEAQVREGARIAVEGQMRDRGRGTGMPGDFDSEDDDELPALSDEPFPEERAVDARYDDARNQHWLAGTGLIALREAAATHGGDVSAWSQEDRTHLDEYAKRVLQLETVQSRNFILTYVLPQGTSKEVKAMVEREIGRQKEART